MFAPTKTLSIKFGAALAAAATALSLSSVASAEPFQSNGKTMEVRYSDLDLTKASDQKKLRSRIARAASKVCFSNDLSGQAECRVKALANVEAPIARAIARAENTERYADASSDARANASLAVTN